MGGSVSAYIGPVIVAEFQLKDEKLSHFKCSKCKTAQSKENNFCNRCGGKVEDFPTIIQVPYPHGLYEEFNGEVLCSYMGRNLLAGKHVYHSNLNDGPRKFYIHTPQLYEVMLNIKDIDVEAEKLWMAERFKKEIEVIKSFYVSHTIEWVFMSRYH